MKISEMTNEQAADALVRIAGPLGSLCDDEQITEMIKTYRDMEETPMVKVIGKFLPEIAAVAFKKHRDDILEIVGALTMQTKAAAGKMNFLETIRIIREAFTDETLTGFFTSFRGRANATGTGSAQGSSGTAITE